MAKIFIQPDADGDLHTAALHNDKFQVILNEINGNLDEKNLKYPNSIVVFESSFAVSSLGVTTAGVGTVHAPVGLMHVNTNVYTPGYDNTNGRVNVLENSFALAFQAMEVKEVMFGIHESSAFVNGQDWTFTAATAPAPAAASTWTTLATVDNDAYNAGGYDVLILTPGLSSSTVLENSFLRVTMTVPSTFTGTYVTGFSKLPPPMWCKITCSTSHL
jgi:hypothetical protein